jgi:hypothetical protein
MYCESMQPRKQQCSFEEVDASCLCVEGLRGAGATRDGGEVGWGMGAVRARVAMHVVGNLCEILSVWIA